MLNTSLFHWVSSSKEKQSLPFPCLLFFVTIISFSKERSLKNLNTDNISPRFDSFTGNASLQRNIPLWFLHSPSGFYPSSEVLCQRLLKKTESSCVDCQQRKKKMIQRRRTGKRAGGGNEQFLTPCFASQRGRQSSFATSFIWIFYFTFPLYCRFSSQFCPFNSSAIVLLSCDHFCQNYQLSSELNFPVEQKVLLQKNRTNEQASFPFSIGRIIVICIFLLSFKTGIEDPTEEKRENLTWQKRKNERLCDSDPSRVRVLPFPFRGTRRGNRYRRPKNKKKGSKGKRRITSSYSVIVIHDPYGLSRLSRKHRYFGERVSLSFLTRKWEGERSFSNGKRSFSLQYSISQDSQQFKGILSDVFCLQNPYLQLKLFVVLMCLRFLDLLRDFSKQAQ